MHASTRARGRHANVAHAQRANETQTKKTDDIQTKGRHTGDDKGHALQTVFLSAVFGNFVIAQVLVRHLCLFLFTWMRV